MHAGLKKKRKENLQVTRHFVLPTIPVQNRNNKTNGRLKPIYCRGGGGDGGYMSTLKTTIIGCLSTGRLHKQCNTIRAPVLFTYLLLATNF